MESLLLRAQLSALVALAETLAESGQLESGVQMLALASARPAADQDTRERAKSGLESLRLRMAPAPFEALTTAVRTQTLVTLLDAQGLSG